MKFGLTAQWNFFSGLISSRIKTAAILVTLGFSLPLSATPLFGFEPAGPNQGYMSIQSPSGGPDEGQWSAQAFTLDTALSLSAIEFGLYHSGTFDGIVQLAKGSPVRFFEEGFGDHETLLTASVGRSGALPSYESFSIAADLTLEAGDYFLVVANTVFNGPSFGWAFGNNLISSTSDYGAVGDLFGCLNRSAQDDCVTADPSQSSWGKAPGELNERDMDFRLIDAVAAADIPEPQTLWMLFLGVAAIASLRGQNTEVRR